MIGAMDHGTFADLRRDYGDEALRGADLPADPMRLFSTWLAAAADAGANEPNAMALATVDERGDPHSRVVLLKTLEAGGLTFFTNRTSPKSDQLRHRARAAATFWWHLPRDRQVRVLGDVEPTSDELSQRYFESRPRAAQLASAASPQSRVVVDREELEALVDRLAAAVGDGPVPRPAHWGGYTLRPEVFEFWQGRAARLHDRFRYRREGLVWRLERLAP